MSSNIKIFKFIFTADIGRLSIKTAISCPISATWKRSAEVSKTDQVSFANGVAQFNQTISLPVNMYFDQNLKSFQQKKSQFSFTLHTPKGEKSAGIVVVDLAIMLNNKLETYEQDFKVDKCPDKDAKVHINIKSQLLGEQNQNNTTQMNSSQIVENSMTSGIQQNQSHETTNSVLGNLHSESVQIKELKEKITKLTKEKEQLKTQLAAVKKNPPAPVVQQLAGDEELKKEIDKLNKQITTLKTQMIKSKGIQQKLEKQLNEMRNQYHEHDKELEGTRIKLEAAYQKLVSALGNYI